MRPSQRQFRFNKKLRFFVATLIAALLPITWALGLGAANAKSAGGKPAAVRAAQALPPAVPQVDDIPSAGHLNDAPAAAPAALTNLGQDDIPGAGHLVEPGPADNGAAATSGLQLDVLINGYKIDLVAAFVLQPDGAMTAKRSELKELGLKVPGQGPDDEQINLATIPSLQFVYDKDQQTIDLKIGDSGREPKSIAVIPPREFVQAESDLGLVLNYSAYGATTIGMNDPTPHFAGASMNLDARIFSNFGVFQQTGVVSTSDFSKAKPIRLDTNWSYSSQERAETYTVGDVISGGLSWTRPVRMGGAQIQRNFSVRPDLITKPLPSLVGSAAVPSTVDVYINNAKTFSQKIDPGPFSIDHLPVITSQGTARVVITDTTGKQTQSETPIYTSAALLAPGYFDYSLDLGLARRSFGTENFDYDNALMAIASARYGINTAITAEAHAEAREDMLEGGLGGVFVAGPLGSFNFAAAASMFQGEMGYYGYGSWDFQLDNLIVRASTARTLGRFVDLASVTEVPLNGIVKNGVPKALDQLSVSYGFQGFDAGAGLSVIHQVTSDDKESLLLAATASKSFGSDISVYANAYFDVVNQSDYGAFIGFSMPFGKTISASAGASLVKGSPAASVEVARPLDTSYGSYGWRVTDNNYAGDNHIAAEGTYRDSHAVVSGRITNNGTDIYGNATVEGSVVATKSGVFLGNPIADSFAVVDAGVEGIDVSYENRFIGKTGKNGKLLISQLHAYQKNKISIDPQNLPINASISETDKYVAPRNKSGVLVDFGVKKDGNGVIVILQDQNGKFVSPGTAIKVDGKDEPFVMGYDGEVFLTDIPEHVSLTAEGANATCAASFDFKADEQTQTSIGPLKCL
jgi:outer membrane usher protein